MKYRKKPVVIDALQFFDTPSAMSELSEFLLDLKNIEFKEGKHSTTLLIETLEGTMTAQEGDFIIKGVEGEFYPCKPDIFRKTYEEV